MRLLRDTFVLLALFAASSIAQADTIDFTVTITKQVNLSTVPVGTVYTGFAHYKGSFDPNFTGFPPALDSYGFDYPSAPASLAGFKWEFAAHAAGQPLYVDLVYVDLSYPGASFEILDNLFQIILPTDVTDNSVGYTTGEIGTVTYSYVADPPSSVPEPSSLVFEATGLLAILGYAKRQTYRPSRLSIH